MRIHPWLIGITTAFALSGCAQPATAPAVVPADPRPPAPAEPVPPLPPVTSAPVAPPPSRPATTDPQDCYNGECVLEMSGPTEIPLDQQRFFYRGLAVSTTSGGMTIRSLHPERTGMATSVGIGSSISMNMRGFAEVHIRALALDGDTSALELTTRSP